MDKKNVIFLVVGLGVGFIAGAIADAYSETIQDGVDLVLNKTGLKKQIMKTHRPEENTKHHPTKTVINTSDTLNFNKPDPRDILKYKNISSENGYSTTGRISARVTADKESHKPIERVEPIQSDGVIEPRVIIEPENDIPRDEDPSIIESLGDRAEVAASMSDLTEDEMFEYITQETFDSDNGLDKILLDYFPNEDVLVAGKYDEPANPDYLVGHDAYNDLLKNEEETIFVRNNNIGADICITIEDGQNYYDWIRED